MRSYRIHHISDMHLGAALGPALPGFEVLSSGQTPYSQQYLNYLQIHDDKRPDYVIISGDISNLGTDQGFEQGLEFLRQLEEHLVEHEESEQRQRILLVPGNHDVNREAKRYEDQLALFRDTFRDYRTPFSPAAPKSTKRPWKYAPLFYYKRDNFMVLLLASDRFVQAYPPEFDTVWAELPEEARDRLDPTYRSLTHIDCGVVDDSTLQATRSQYRRTKKELGAARLHSSLKIAVLHRPAFQAPHHDAVRPFTSLVNAGQIKHLLQEELKFDVLLHGHSHKDFLCYQDYLVGRDTPGVHMIAAGTIGGDSAHGRSFNEIIVHTTEKSDLQVIEVCRLESEGSLISPSASRKLGSFVRDRAGRLARIEEAQINALTSVESARGQRDLDLLHAELERIHKKLDRFQLGYTEAWLNKFRQELQRPHSYIYATDIQGMDAWSEPVVFYYFMLQAKLYMEQVLSEGTWRLRFSPPVHQALKRITEADSDEEVLLELFSEEAAGQTRIEGGDPQIEFVRILLWNDDQLTDPRVDLLLQLHEQLRIPLLRLDPSRVEDQWRRVEYIVFEGPTKPRGVWIRPSDARMTEDRWLNRQGRIPRLGAPLEHFHSLLEDPELQIARVAREQLLQD